MVVSERFDLRILNAWPPWTGEPGNFGTGAFMTANALPSIAQRAGKTLLITSFLIPVWPAIVSAGQIGQTPPPPPGLGRSGPPGVNEPGPFDGINSAKMEHMREDERRKRMLSDTAKLVTLSNELKADVEKTTRDELSVDVVRKAAEIEKLAHDVRERMRS